MCSQLRTIVQGHTKEGKGEILSITFRKTPESKERKEGRAGGEGS